MNFPRVFSPRPKLLPAFLIPDQNFRPSFFEPATKTFHQFSLHDQNIFHNFLIFLVPFIGSLIPPRQIERGDSKSTFVVRGGEGGQSKANQNEQEGHKVKILDERTFWITPRTDTFGCRNSWQRRVKVLLYPTLKWKNVKRAFKRTPNLMVLHFSVARYGHLKFVKIAIEKIENVILSCT